MGTGGRTGTVTPLLAAPAAPTLTLVSGALWDAPNKPKFTSAGDFVEGDTVRVQRAALADTGFASPTEFTNAIDAAEDAANLLEFSDTWPDGSYRVRDRIERPGHLPSGWSNEPTLTIDTTTATNLLLKTQAFDDAAWTKGPKAAVNANATAAPDATTTADLLYSEFDGAEQQYALQQVTAAAATYTLSVYAKANTWQWLALSIYDGSQHYAFFDLINGVTGAIAAGASASMTGPDGQGYYRCIYTRAAGAIDPIVTILPTDADNSLLSTASGTHGVYLWGAQLETGSSAHAYVPHL